MIKLREGQNSNRGFTLIELLIVILIVSILAGVGVASYSTTQKRARDAKRKEDIKAIQVALEQYYSAANQYPLNCYINGSLQYEDSGETFMSNFPVDPKNDISYSYEGSNCSTATYTYRAHLEVSGGGNAFSDCTQTDPNTEGTKDYFCLSNLQ